MMTIEIDQHAIEGAENDLRTLLMKYDFEDLKAAVSNLDLGSENVPPPTNDRLHQPVGQVIKWYILNLPSFDFADTTKKDYKEYARNFAKFCHRHLKSKLKTELSQVLTRKTISDWVDWRCPPHIKDATRNKVVAFTRGFLRKIIKNVPEEALDALQFRDTGDMLPRSYTTEQVTEMLEVSRRGGNNFRNRTILYVLVGSGIRVDELCLLQLKDVNFEDGTIKVHPKRRKNILSTRYVNSDAFDVLANYIRFTFGDPGAFSDGDKRYIFTGIGRVNRMSTRTVEKMVKDLQERCTSITELDRKRLDVHSFRHFFALSQLRNGVDIYTIAKLLGHESVTSAEIYLRMFNEELREAVNRLDLTRISEKQLVLIQGTRED